ncbi:Protein N-acetyltransferase, RimJ/RimL family [Clostridium acidisoli DSM 12555]|uniref:Protein N-acetyltransferase, RimJ/RimL family n=1 Tax=Clostridium acidisoli DSM 12555 TaxID=1121291 RepID=A0A1W1WXS5_9CLOT|nr:GNAT family N-acetyltransferase [Clostridium acidisoli]SMC16546.1 Protein N-acetyltransferase, RimJ/RimL family [Clostridium acidisoli DSM 12555]
MKDFFMETNRIGFSKWKDTDLNLSIQLWGDQDVTRFICANGKFSNQDISNRLGTEIFNEKHYHIQYWPIFELASGELIGCCGLRPFKSEANSYEMGIHLCKKYWRMGYAFEASKLVINYGFTVLKAEKLYAGHHPENEASEKLLTKLGFRYIGKNYYEPTGLYHPSYELINDRL